MKQWKMLIILKLEGQKERMNSNQIPAQLIYSRMIVLDASKHRLPGVLGN